MKPWKIAGEAQAIDVVSPEGEVRSKSLGYFAGSHIIVEDMMIDVRPGDEIRRLLPNGKEEAYLVDDPTCFTSGPFGPHYQIKVSRPKIYQAHTGGNYHVTVSGPNARVNISSTDNSTNVVNGNVFDQVREALNSAGIEANELRDMRQKLAALEAAETQSAFGKAYQAFVSSLSDHVTVLTPLLPALTAVIGSLPN